MLFEYGGAPRKMLPGISVFTALVGVPRECVKRVVEPDCQAAVFRTSNRAVAVAWKPAHARSARTIAPVPGVSVRDIMGNEAAKGPVELSDSPVYLAGDRAEDLLRALGNAR
jgi:hypothetical protein